MIPSFGNIGIIGSLRNYSTDGLIANVDFNNDYGFAGNTANDLQKPVIKYNTPGGYVSVVKGSTARPGYIEFDGVTDYLIATEGATGAATEFAGLTCGTVDVWVYIAQTTASAPTLVSNNSLNTGATARGFSLITTQSPPIARFAFNNGTSTLGVSIPGLTGATGEWNNYFGRFQADGNNAKVTGIVFRPNGLSAYNLITGATAANLANGMTSNNLLAIGRRSAQATQYLNGRIGSVRIYNRLLSQSEMEFNYNRSKTRYGHT